MIDPAWVRCDARCFVNDRGDLPQRDRAGGQRRMTMVKTATAAVALCVMTCQTKQQPSREAPASSPLVSRAEPSQPASPRRAVPPLPDPLPGVRKDVTSFVGGAL